MLTKSILFVATCAISFTGVQGSPLGASGCGSGEAAVSGGHTARNPQPGNGALSDGDIQINILDETGTLLYTADPTTIGILNPSTNYIIQLDATTATDPMRGFLIRVGSDDFETLGMLEVPVGDDTAQTALPCPPLGIAGITHTSNSEKTVVSGLLNIPSAGTVSVDVTVVARNCGPQSSTMVGACDPATSTYWWSQYTFNVQDGPIDVPVPAPDVPTSSPSDNTESTPTSSPTAVDTPTISPTAVETPTSSPTDTTTTASPTDLVTDDPTDAPTDDPTDAPMDPTAGPSGGTPDIPPEPTSEPSLAGMTNCEESGGSVAIEQCCIGTEAFRDTCTPLIGACGCSPMESADVLVCNCPMGSCFNGTACVAAVIPADTPAPTESPTEKPSEPKEPTEAPVVEESVEPSVEEPTMDPEPTMVPEPAEPEPTPAPVAPDTPVPTPEPTLPTASGNRLFIGYVVTAAALISSLLV